MKKKWLAAPIIYIALIILCVAVIYIVPSVKGLLEKTYVTEQGSISISDDVSGYILRDEVVYVAGFDCKVERVAEHDVLTKAKTTIVKITPVEDGSSDKDADDQAAEDKAADAEDTDDDDGSRVHRKYRSILEDLADHTQTTRKGRSKDAGYISYFVDGAEAKLAVSRVSDLTEKDLKSFTDMKQVETPDSKARAGEPVFKVTKNRRWYLVFFLENSKAEKYYAGRYLTMKIGDEDVTVRVAYTEPGEKRTKIALSCKRFYEGFLDTRRLDTTVTVASAEGLVLKDTSIVEKDGQKGVLVKNKLGEHVFKPILIKADNGENCVAYADIYVDEGGNFVETIGTYDEIVEMPTPEEVESLNEGSKDNSEDNN